MKDESMKISPELWEPLEQEEKDAEKIERPSLTFLQDGWRRLRSNWVAMFSMVVILLITVGAIVIPWFWPILTSSRTWIWPMCRRPWKPIP